MTSLTLTPYQRRYLQPVRDLLFHSYLVHTHLDWHETDQWLEAHTGGIRLAWQGNRLAGLMALSDPLHDTCWIRLAAVQENLDRKAVLKTLWDDLLPEVRAAGVRTVSLLAVRDWITEDVPALGFEYVEDIVTLARYGQQIPEPLPHRLHIRTAEPRDLPDMTRVDHAAFSPPWQLAPDELRQAYRISASCTVALHEGALVGYQLSTLYFDGSHLARLAVMPYLQGKGVGGTLLGDVLQRFFKRGVYAMTLNTQASNTQSQHLYRRFGFRPNGYDLPYWVATVG